MAHSEASRGEERGVKSRINGEGRVQNEVCDIHGEFCFIQQ